MKIAKKYVAKDAPRNTIIMAQKSAVGGPLRQLISFSRGVIDQEGVHAIILIIKGRLLKGVRLLLQTLKKNQNRPSKKSLYF